MSKWTTEEIKQAGVFYECDPVKNIECEKSGCHADGGGCRHIHLQQYAKNGAQGLAYEEAFKIGEFFKQRRAADPESAAV